MLAILNIPVISWMRLYYDLDGGILQIGQGHMASGTGVYRNVNMPGL